MPLCDPGTRSYCFPRRNPSSGIVQRQNYCRARPLRRVPSSLARLRFCRRLRKTFSLVSRRPCSDRFPCPSVTGADCAHVHTIPPSPPGASPLCVCQTEAVGRSCRADVFIRKHVIAGRLSFFRPGEHVIRVEHLLPDNNNAPVFRIRGTTYYSRRDFR